MSSPERLGKYRLLNLIASGGMGEVFLARHEGPAGFSKLVVVKRILRHLASDQGFVEMFLNEARLAARLSHPNIVQIFELGHEDDEYFIAMEYVHGKSVRSAMQRLEQRRTVWPADLAAWVCAQGLLGLHHAHAQRDEKGQPAGVIHRDVSPENVLVSFEGNVKLADFGLAKAATVAVTRVGTLKGKFAYMAPEQLRKDRLDPRTDVFAMGVTLYELLTDQFPYGLPDTPASLEEAFEKPPVPLRQRNPKLPLDLEELVMSALERDPARRFPSAMSMAQALEDFLRRWGSDAGSAKLSALLRALFGAEAMASLPASDGKAALRGTAPIESDSALKTIIDSARGALRRRSRPWVIAGAVGAFLIAGAGGASWLLRARTSPEPLSPPPPVEATVAAPPAPEPAPPPAPEPEPTPPATHAEPERPPVHPARPHHVALAPGRVRVRVNPWADVFLDGQILGTTPMPPTEVPAGAHVITLRNSQLGVERRFKVKVSPGEETLVKANLLE